jgi:hypothetical protein
MRITRSSTTPEAGISWLTLFASTGTLICCALPILLVSLGFGATVAAMTSSFPLLITLSEHKGWVFGFSGIMLLLSLWLIKRPGRHCPVEPSKATACRRAQRWNLRVISVSLVIWSIGFFAAFLALPLRRAFSLLTGVFP